MNLNSEWEPVLRLVWITGGIVAAHEPGPDVQIKAGINGNTLRTLRISASEELFEALQMQGFGILGATFVVSQEEVEGLRPAEFRAMSRTKRWLVFAVHQEWRQIAFAAGNGGDMPLMDVASRIAAGLNYSQLRLEELVTAYSLQLRARLHDNKPSEYQRFKDTNCFRVYKAIHALFWEMAVLRDTLAEFAARFCFSVPELRTMSGLRKKLLSTNSASDPLVREILDATDESSGGWLAKFSSYRNCFTHAAPMEQAAGIAFAVQDMRAISDSLALPQIYYPLPANIDEIARKRSSGIFFLSLEELIAASAGRHDRPSEPDALEYLHNCVNLFGELAHKFVAQSPIAPRPIEIGPEDIVGQIRVTT